MIEVREIMQRIPHRFPMLLIDKVIELEPQQRGVGIKNVTINEPYFQGHFSEFPIVPGVLIIESLAQLAAVVFSKPPVTEEGVETADQRSRYNSKEDRPGYLADVKMRYREPVKPGDVIRLEVSLIKRMGHTSKVKAIAYVDDKIAAQGELTFA